MVPNEQVPRDIDAHLEAAILEAHYSNNVSQATLNNHGLSQEIEQVIEDNTNESNTQMINTTNIPIQTRDS